MEKIIESNIEITVKNAEGDPDTKATIIHQNKIDFEPKVSVIIPVYNTEEYLRECLDSVINQTLKEIEIICIDDGSTDSSLKILKEYAQKDNRFTIISQQNLYAGVARNAGLAVAKGEYLSFLDSDDWFESDMLHEMVTNIEKEKSEICCCQYKNINTVTGEVENFRGINHDFKSGSIITYNKNDYTNNLYTISNPMPWNKLFSHKFIKDNNIYFQSLISSNDIYFSMLSMSLCNKFTLVIKPLVNYRFNRQTSLKNSRDKHPLSFYYAYKGLYKTLREYKNLQELKPSFYKAFVSTCIWTLNNTVKKREFVKNYIKNDIVSEFLLLKDNKKFIPEYLYNKLISLYNPDLIISLTSFPARINTVHVTIESLINQSMCADKVILWLAKEQFPNKEADLPQKLLNLKEQGLIIDWYQDIRSYKKLIPTLKKYPNTIIVTADDDNIYPNQWLEKLYNNYLKYPKDIQAHRITKFFYKHGFEIIAGGQDYYQKPSYLNKLVGLGGVLYPPNCFYKDILNEELFMKLAPTNDDQWFWLQAVLNGTKVRVVKNPEIKANYIEGTQEFGLFNINDAGEKLFWKDFHRLLEYYPQLKGILIKESKKMSSKNYGIADKYKEDLQNWYKRVTKKDLDLENPKTFNEKIQWLKLYDSTPIKTQLADKYLVRDWVKEKIGEEYLIPLLGVYDNFDEIDFDSLPHQFVLKCNHGSGYNIIVKDKSIFNKEEARLKIDKWMQENFAYKWGVELHYKNITPKIIIEKYLETEDNDLQDYKFLCFNGKIKYIWVDQGRYTDHKRNLYNLNWELQKEKISEKKEYENFPHKQPPSNLGKMIKFAEKLSEGFCFVRVDFYEHESQLYFGEMTFTSSSGTHIFTPDKLGLKLGKLIKLPKLAYNIDTDDYYKLPFPWKYHLQRIFSIKNDNKKKHKVITILSLKIKLKRNCLEKIFSVKNIDTHKVVTILGLKFKLKNKKLIQRKQIEHLEWKINNANNQIITQQELLDKYQDQIITQQELLDKYQDQTKLELNKLKQDYNQKISSEKKKLLYNLHKYLPEEKRKKALIDWYYERTGEVLNLEAPQSFNEKIQWLKLYDSTPEKTRLADKYLVRDWVKEKIGEEYLIPLLGVWDKFDDIDFDSLPEQFVLKCNHGSGYNIVVSDKSEFDKEAARKKINSWMNEDFAFKAGFEMHYTDISRKIIAEQYVKPELSNIEIQSWCFHNEIEFISYETCKDSKESYRAIFTPDWEPENFMVTPRHYSKFPELPAKPEYLEELKYVVSILSQGFKHVRVDFIVVDGKLKFREMTFTSASGLSTFEPIDIKYDLGKKLNI